MTPPLVRGRDGDMYDVPDDENHDCSGWVGEDTAGRPIPCPRCRPETIARLRRLHDRIGD